MSIERRRYPRYELFAQVRVKYGTVNYILAVRNISRSGMFLDDNGTGQLSRFRKGQFLELDLFFEGDLENVRVYGEIVRTVEDESGKVVGVGVNFREIVDEESFELIVANAAKVPPPLPKKQAGLRKSTI